MPRPRPFRADDILDVESRLPCFTVRACNCGRCSARLDPSQCVSNESACPLSTQQSSKYDVEWARRERRLLGINRQLSVFRRA